MVKAQKDEADEEVALSRRGLLAAAAIAAVSVGTGSAQAAKPPAQKAPDPYEVAHGS